MLDASEEQRRAFKERHLFGFNHAEDIFATAKLPKVHAGTFIDAFDAASCFLKRQYLFPYLTILRGMIAFSVYCFLFLLLLNNPTLF